MPLDTGYPVALFRLAEWLADPAGWHPGDPAIPDTYRKILADSPFLRPLLNDWIAQTSGLGEIDWDHMISADMARSEEISLAIALLTEPDDRLLSIARFLGASLWVDRLRRTILRSDRDKLAEQLGAEAMAFGLRRAPVLAKALMENPLARTATDPVAAGYALSAALIARAHPRLHDLFRIRMPNLPDPVPLTDRQAQAAWAILAIKGTVA